jgi:hypothetical protein
MRARLRTLAVIGALTALPPGAAAARSDAPSPPDAAPSSTAEVRPEAPLARGLLPVPAWVVGAAFSSVTLLAIVGLVHLRRSPRS